jgi:hypothetical protein
VKAVLVAAIAALGISVAAHGAEPARRPHPVEACNAWREHISDLIEQHRTAGEMDEKALFAFVRQFIAARDACRPGRYEIGLRLYEEIALGRPLRPLK